MANKDQTQPLIAIVHYGEVEQAARDAQLLEESGFHPVIRKPKDRADAQPPDDTEEAHDLVMYVPEPEARLARETLQEKVEAQGDPEEEGYE